MSAQALIRQAQASGVALRLVGGKVKASGPREAVARLLVPLREHRAELADALQAELYRLGFANILTSTILNDHLLPRISSSEIIANVGRSIHPGNIILLHDGGSHTQTVNAFPGIIDIIHSQGYEIVRLEEVLATGTLQYQALTYETTASEIATAEGIEGADEVIDTVVELRTYLELNTNLSAPRRAMVEAMIADARLAARD